MFPVWSSKMYVYCVDHKPKMIVTTGQVIVYLIDPKLNKIAMP